MTLASHTPATWNDILSTTFANYHKTLTDNVFNTRPLLQHLMGNGRVKPVGGGHAIVEQLLYKKGDAGSYGEWDAVQVVPQNTVTAAQFPWKQIYATVAISGLEEAQNSGKEQIEDLLEAKILQAEETLKEDLNGMIFGTQATPVATDFAATSGSNGLPGYIAAAANEVGGIVNEAWWDSKVDTGASIDGATLEKKLRDLYNSTSDAGGDTVDAIFTNEYGFGFYESTLTPQVRYTDTSKANLGFQNLLFKNCPIMWDFQCSGGTEGTVATTSASFYGINSKYVGLKIHRDRNFKQSPFTDNLAGGVGTTAGATAGHVPGVGAASAQALDARISFITTFGNLTMRNRRRLFKLTGVTEA